MGIEDVHCGYGLLTHGQLNEWMSPELPSYQAKSKRQTIRDMGVAQHLRARVTQVLVFVSTQGAQKWAPLFDPQPCDSWRVLCQVEQHRLEAAGQASGSPDWVGRDILVRGWFKGTEHLQSFCFFLGGMEGRGWGVGVGWSPIFLFWWGGGGGVGGGVVSNLFVLGGGGEGQILSHQIKGPGLIS